jgi:hypothetical protein
MGLQDRDYMRGRHRGDNVRQFRPPEPTVRSTLWMILFWVFFTFLCYKAWNWWHLQQIAPPPAVTPMSVSPRPASPPKQHPNLTGNWDPARTMPTQLPPSPAQGVAVQTFTKCVVNGVTSYTDGECAPNAKRSHVTINPAENLADGLRVAAPVRAHPSEPPPQIVQHGPDVGALPNVHLEKKLLCEKYDEEIKHIDARARQPLPGSEQDRLAALRKKARDEQFRLRC